MSDLKKISELLEDISKNMSYASVKFRNASENYNSAALKLKGISHEQRK